MDRTRSTDPEAAGRSTADEHLTADLLLLLFTGDLPAESLLGLLLSHLRETCLQCARAFEELDSQVTPAEAEVRRRITCRDAVASYGAAFEAAVATAQALTPTVATGVGAARAAELQQLTPAEGYARLIDDPGLATPSLCIQLLEGAQPAPTGDLGRAAELARLALATAQRIDPRRFPKGLILDCQAESWAALGAIDLLRGDDDGSESAFLCAESLLAAGSGDPLALARVSSGRAQLLRRQGDLEGCLVELARAVDLYGAGGDPHDQGQTLLHRGLVLQQLGRASEAREVLQAGIGLLDPIRDHELAARVRAALLESLDGGGPSATPARPH